MAQYLLKYTFWGNSVRHYLLCILIIMAGFLAIKIFQRFILKRLKKWAEKTATTVDDFLVATLQSAILPIAYFGIVYLGIIILNLNPFCKKIVNIAGITILTIFTAKTAISFITYGFSIYGNKRGGSIVLEHSFKGILRVIKIVIWALAIIFLLDNLGFKISTVLAGLGIGGVAIALASQAILGDLFSYFAILLDHPFEIGDFIIIGENLGTVEYIGIKTTRIRSLSGEQLVFCNTDLTNSRVRNYKKMAKRRVAFKLGVTYQTSLEQLKIIPKIIENIIKGIKDTAFDRAHFFSYGDSSLIFEIVYYVMGNDYNKYMDIQQEINLKIKEEFDKHSIEFAYPTQTLYIEKNS